MNIPFLDLSRQYATIYYDIEKAVLECVRSGKYILGKTVEKFENEMAAYCKSNHAIGVSSGSDALLVSLMAENIGPGDKIITTPFTFFATAGAISRVGATPVFVDIEADGFNIDPAKIEAAIDKNTRAIIPVHLFGQCADMDSIMAIAEKHNLAVIEDAAQAIGATYKGRRAGSIGHYGCFSFFPSKNLGCMGDGGVVIANDSKRADRVRMLRNHGAKPKYYHQLIGGNFRLDAMQAAILSTKLPYLNFWNEQRRNNANDYRRLLSQIELLICPVEVSGRHHVYNQFTLRICNDGRDKVVEYLKDKNIGCEIYYPLPLHLQPCYESLNYKKGDLPIAEKTAKEVISLPIFPELTIEEKIAIADAAIYSIKGS